MCNGLGRKLDFWGRLGLGFDMNKFSSGAQSLAETTKYWLNTFWAAVHILLLLHLIYLNTFAVYLQNFGQSFSAMTKTSQGIIAYCSRASLLLMLDIFLRFGPLSMLWKERLIKRKHTNKLYVGFSYFCHCISKEKILMYFLKTMF